jgi:F-type H+-transporting ATPase subunit a
LLLAEEAESKVVEVLEHEFGLQTVVPLPRIMRQVEEGGEIVEKVLIDFSITNAVIYLWVSAIVVFLFFFIASRRMRKSPGFLQNFAEALVSFGRGHLTGQIGEKGRKFYYLVLTIFVFILVTNLIGLIPKPFALKPYTPTANINVTFALAFAIFLMTHYLGVKNHGPRGYMRSWLLPPGVPKALAVPLNGIFFTVHAVGEIFRPVSLSVRLFGNTLAGHLVILVMLGLILEFVSAIVIIPATLFIVVMTAFEIFVALIQAYIFALLSVIYIEGAIYAGH